MALCPVHLYARLMCTRECAAARRELVRINRDYRQYWYDRRRGQPARRWKTDPRPIWLAWSAA
jgi:hypothetical protein